MTGCSRTRSVNGQTVNPAIPIISLKALKEGGLRLNVPNEGKFTVKARKCSLGGAPRALYKSDRLCYGVWAVV